MREFVRLPSGLLVKKFATPNFILLDGDASIPLATVSHSDIGFLMDEWRTELFAKWNERRSQLEPST